MPRVLALDYGTVRTGAALSDPLGIFAQALPSLPAAVRRDLLVAVTKLCREQNVGEIVVGLPRRLDGSEGDAAVQARAMGERVRAATKLPVHYLDERLTTAAAQRVMIAGDASRHERREKIDGMAAVMILQNFLDRREANAPPVPPVPPAPE